MRHLIPLVLPLVVAGCTQNVGIANIQPGGVGTVPDLGPEVKTDTIIQVTKPRVDVLWVLDDSCSMAEEQVKLQTNFPLFIEFFLDSGLDWHVGVISTDTDDPEKKGKLRRAVGYRYLDPQTVNPVQVFNEISTLGTGGSYTERGLLAARLALTSSEPDIRQRNEGFYRDDAALHIITISDENDQSVPRQTAPEFIAWLKNLKDDPDTPVTFNSIVGPPPTGCSTDGTDAAPGTVYARVTAETNGIFRSICEEEWAPVLEELGLAAAGLRREYFLTDIPVAATLEVWVDDRGQQRNGVNVTELAPGQTAIEFCRDPKVDRTACFAFEYNSVRNSIVLTDGYVPNPDAVVNITYTVLKSDESAGDDIPLPPGGGFADTADTGDAG